MGAKLVETLEALNECKQQEKAVFFKHSLTCNISADAIVEFENFTKEHPEIPTYILYVQEAREISNQIAEESGVRHQSPQALYYKNGEIVKNESHWRIKKELLEEWIQE